MKKIIPILFISLLSAGILSAQVNFFDDFESYTAGDLIAASSPDWSTWSGTGGGSDDAPISTEQAHSGINSLKLYSTSTGGGPSDVILPFGDKYTEGNFNLEMYMYVVSGTGAYFNLQGEVAVGSTWALDVTFTPDGAFTYKGISGTFPLGEWFKLSVNIDLTANNWDVLINDVSQGSFSNATNSVASMDLFPLYSGGTSQFYVDDVSFEYIPLVLPDVDAAMSSVSVRTLNLVGNEVVVTGKVRNTGLNPLTSMDITWSDGTNEHKDVLIGLNVPSLEYYDYTHSAQYTVASGDNTFEIWVDNVNGLAEDGNPDNNLKSITVTGLVPAPGKRVVVEEGTGTWCGWCPRGAVFMEAMYEMYPDYFIPIAVHNGDAMTVAEYDDNLGLTAFPTMKIMREEAFGFGVVEDIESRFFDRIVVAPPATLLSGGVYNASTGDLTVTSQANFSSAVSGTHRLAVVLVEDGVTGYSQANYYSGGGNGPMGGYESLPNPVPASQMVYDHVGRILVGGFFGAAGSVPAPVTAGQVVTFTFDAVNIPSSYNTANMHAVTLLIGPNGNILNATSQTFQELLDTEIINGTEEKFSNEYAEVYPNPFSDAANVSLKLETPSQVSLRIFNAMGAEVAFRNYGVLSGDLVFPLDASNLPAGVYQVHIKMDDHLITKKIVIQR